MKIKTLFPKGPKTQCNKMWHVRRRYTTAFYLVMLIIVFAVAVAVSRSSLLSYPILSYPILSYPILLSHLLVMAVSLFHETIYFTHDLI